MKMLLCLWLCLLPCRCYMLPCSMFCQHFLFVEIGVEVEFLFVEVGGICRRSRRAKILQFYCKTNKMEAMYNDV